MKAKINKDGCLIVESENELEEFALCQWRELWAKNEVTLYIGIGDAGVCHPNIEALEG